MTRWLLLLAVAAVAAATSAASATGAVSATDAASATDAVNATDAVSATNSVSATDAVSVTNGTSATDAVNATDAAIATDAASATDGASATSYDAPVAAGSCPARCNCSVPDGELEYECRRGRSAFTLLAQINHFIRLTCQNEALQCSDVPRVQLSQGWLSSASVTSCGAPPIACVLGRVGATAVGRLTLDEPRGPITSKLFEGLTNVTFLMIKKAVDQISLPYEAIDSLPQLRDFRLHNTAISLRPVEGVRRTHPALERLELMGCGLAALPPASLNLPGLKKLSLWANKITHLTADSFIGLESLEELELSSNPLEELAGGALGRLARLRRLALGGRLARVHSRALDGLTQLEEVSIRVCGSSLSVGPRSFGSLPSLRRLGVQQCAAGSMPADMLRGSTALTDLKITSAALEALPEDFFQGLSNLSQLDLSRNKLQRLPPKLFWPLAALTALNLDNNRIQSLPSQLFAGLKNLRTFTANSNGLAAIAPGAFAGAVAMTTVSLAANRLTLRTGGQYSDVSRQSPFSALTGLKELNLRDNSISEMMDDWKYVHVNLQRLDLSGNNFSELFNPDVEFLSKDVVVDLRRNKITTIEVTEYPSDAAGAPPAGRMLLDDNPYNCDCFMYSFIRRIRGLAPAMTGLILDVGSARCHSPHSLSGLQVKYVTPEVLQCTLPPTSCPEHCACAIRPANVSIELDCDQQVTEYPDLDHYGMNVTKLRLHTPTSLATLPSHVTFLNMTGVGLTDADDMPLTVQVADLTHNNLSHPPRLLKSNMSVYLAGNPFVCDCDHWEDVATLQKYSQKILDYKNVTCAGDFVWRVDAARLCDVRRAAILGGTLAAFGVLLVMMAVVCYLYRREITLIMRRWFPRLFTPEYNKNAKYDAFISFAQQDAKWVAQELVPRLEEKKGLHLCVHYRDWEIGEMIPDQIARSVQESNKTVIILTEHFIKSQWARLEFNTAYASSKVLVIILGEVPKREDLDDGLGAYITTNTYLKWGDPWFWEKLEDALPKRPSRPDDLLPKKLRRGLNGVLNDEGKLVNDIA